MLKLGVIGLIILLNFNNGFAQYKISYCDSSKVEKIAEFKKDISLSFIKSCPLEDFLKKNIPEDSITDLTIFYFYHNNGLNKRFMIMSVKNIDSTKFLMEIYTKDKYKKKTFKDDSLLRFANKLNGAKVFYYSGIPPLEDCKYFEGVLFIKKGLFLGCIINDGYFDENDSKIVNMKGMGELYERVYQLANSR